MRKQIFSSELYYSQKNFFQIILKKRNFQPNKILFLVIDHSIFPQFEEIRIIKIESFTNIQFQRQFLHTLFLLISIKYYKKCINQASFSLTIPKSLFNFHNFFDILHSNLFFSFIFLCIFLIQPISFYRISFPFKFPSNIL